MSSSDEDLFTEFAKHYQSNVDQYFRDLDVEQPGILRKRIRNFLSRLVDQDRLKRPDDSLPTLSRENGFDRIDCPTVIFPSGAELKFSISLEGTRVLMFSFELTLGASRAWARVGIHLNKTVSHEPRKFPRCHFHVNDSEPHIPFPAMHPLAILDLLCRQIEPDLTASRKQRL